jgi:predicted nuclease with TOPRIM domain
MSSSRSGSGDESNNVDGRVAAAEALTALAAQPQQAEVATMMEAIRGEALRAQATLLEQLESKETQLASVTEALKDAKLSNANLRDLFLQISGDYSKKLADAESKYEQKAAKAGSALAKVEAEKVELARQLATEQAAKKEILAKKIFVLTWTIQTSPPSSDKPEQEFYSTLEKANAAKAAICASAKALYKSVVANIVPTQLDLRC